MGTKYRVLRRFTVDETTEVPLIPGVYDKGAELDCTDEQGRFLEQHRLGELVAVEGED